LIWNVTRLGADIGLICENCGRRIMLPRATLERRMKIFIARGSDETLTPEPAPSPAGAFPCEVLGLQVDDELEALIDLEVPVAIYYTTTVDMQTAKLASGDRVRVTRTPAPGSTTAVLEPLDYITFEQRYIPGGVRQQQSYSGYAVIEPCSDLARHFRLIPRSDTAEQASP
jgi:hypothetical protein